MDMADTEDAEDCALCGGELEDHEVSDEREEKIRKNAHDIKGKDVHAKVCTECGHVSYYATDADESA